MENVFPRTSYANYSRLELIGLFEQCKTDPEYVLELKQRLESCR